MESPATPTRWKPSVWRRVLLAAVLGGAVFIPSCSEDEAPPRDVQSLQDMDPAPEPSGQERKDDRPEGVNPYLGYSR